MLLGEARRGRSTRALEPGHTVWGKTQWGSQNRGGGGESGAAEDSRAGPSTAQGVEAREACAVRGFDAQRVGRVVELGPPQSG